MEPDILARNLTIQYLSLAGVRMTFLLVAVDWEAPSFPHGEVEQYQLRIGREEVVEEAANSGAFMLTGLDVRECCN